MASAEQSPARSWLEVVSGTLTYDFCPWANRWVYWIKKPLSSLIIAALTALACALFVKPIALVAFVGILAVIVLGYFWPWVAVRGLACEVGFSTSRAREGEAVRGRLRITNRWPWPIWGLALENGFDTDAESSAAPEVALASVPGWTTAEFSWQFVPARRGEYPFVTPRIGTGFPFGLSRASRPVETGTRLLVWPQTFLIDSLLDSAQNRPSDLLLSEHRVGDSGDLLGTRAFRNGDSLRRVHWAQTARQNRLIVCERQAAAQSAIQIVLDVDPRVHSGDGPHHTLDWCVRVVASLCRAYHAEHAYVECVVGNETHVIAPGSAGFRRFLDVLARIPHGGDAAALETLRLPAPNRLCGTLQLVVTTAAGMQSRPELRGVTTERRLVIIEDGAHPMASLAVHAPVTVTPTHDLPEQFRRRWRRICHAG